MPEQSVSVEFVFGILNIPYPSPDATVIYQRVCRMGQLSYEHATQQRKHPTGAQEDLLAGVDDDDEG